MGNDKSIGNANIFALCAFGYSLFILGLELTVSHKIVGAALYAVLFAGVLEFVGGMWLIAKGDSYLASIVTLFGGWLLGFYMLMTQGRMLHVYNEISVAVYILVLLPPIAFLAIPAFKMGKPKLIGTFVALFAMVFTLGIGYLIGSHEWKYVAGICSYISALFIWWLGVDNILGLFPKD